MANSAQARKRARQAEVTRQRNASLKSTLRTAVKKVKKAISDGPGLIAQAVAAAEQAAASPAAATAGSPPPGAGALTSKVDQGASVGNRIRQ